eukprot:gene13646-13769_t
MSVEGKQLRVVNHSIISFRMAQEALDRRRQERARMDELMRKPSQQPAPPKKPILRKGAGLSHKVAIRPKVEGAIASPPTAAATTVTVTELSQPDLETQRKEWRDGLKNYIARQREAAKGSESSKGVDQSEALSWQELKLAAEAGFEELLKHQEAAAITEPPQQSWRRPGMSRPKGGTPYVSPAAAQQTAASDRAQSAGQLEMDSKQDDLAAVDHQQQLDPQQHGSTIVCPECEQLLPAAAQQAASAIRESMEQLHRATGVECLSRAWCAAVQQAGASSLSSSMALHSGLQQEYAGSEASQQQHEMLPSVSGTELGLSRQASAQNGIALEGCQQGGPTLDSLLAEGARQPDRIRRQLSVPAAGAEQLPRAVSTHLALSTPVSRIPSAPGTPGAGRLAGVAPVLNTAESSWLDLQDDGCEFLERPSDQEVNAVHEQQSPAAAGLPAVSQGHSRSQDRDAPAGVPQLSGQLKLPQREANACQAAGKPAAFKKHQLQPARAAAAGANPAANSSDIKKSTTQGTVSFSQEEAELLASLQQLDARMKQKSSQQQRGQQQQDDIGQQQQQGIDVQVEAMTAKNCRDISHTQLGIAPKPPKAVKQGRNGRDFTDKLADVSSQNQAHMEVQSVTATSTSKAGGKLSRPAAAPPPAALAALMGDGAGVGSNSSSTAGGRQMAGGKRNIALPKQADWRASDGPASAAYEQQPALPGAGIMTGDRLTAAAMPERAAAAWWRQQWQLGAAGPWSQSSRVVVGGSALPNVWPVRGVERTAAVSNQGNCAGGGAIRVYKADLLL